MNLGMSCKRDRLSRMSFCVIAIAALMGCATTRPQINDNLDATIWMQTSAEYEAAVSGAYAQARLQLDAALDSPAWDALPPGERATPAGELPPAIITDADETLIDNSPFQARRILEGKRFEYPRWLAWVNERRSRALPGSVEFMRYAASRGVTIYFVTSRDSPAELDSTSANLRALGFPVSADQSNLLLRGDVRAPDKQKGARRKWVGERHRVLLVLGDNLGDFVDDVDTTIEARQALVKRHADRWGRQWIMIPNPAYGSWEGAITRRCDADLDPTACRRASLRTR